MNYPWGTFRPRLDGLVVKRVGLNQINTTFTRQKSLDGIRLAAKLHGVAYVDGMVGTVKVHRFHYEVPLWDIIPLRDIAPALTFRW